MNKTTPRARHEALQQAARVLIESRGLDITQAIPIRALAIDLAAAQGCHLDTARRHLAKAVRRMRNEESKQWGGTRSGAGRPSDTKGTRMFYGIEYRHGKTMIGGGISLHRFDAKAERDAWVFAGEPIYTNGGYREALLASDSRVRAARAEEEAHGPGRFEEHR